MLLCANPALQVISQDAELRCAVATLEDKLDRADAGERQGHATAVLQHSVLLMHMAAFDGGSRAHLNEQHGAHVEVTGPPAQWKSMLCI